MLMERCWDQIPSVRPHVTEILAFFDEASCGWTPPTSDEIANLGLDQATSQNSPTTQSTFTTFRTAFKTARGGSVSPHEGGPPSPTPNGTDTVAV
jgi:hypothetical protein